MLQMRLEGDPVEAQVLLDALAAAGVEVQTGTVKARREGFSRTYAVVRMPGYTPAGAGDEAPVRAQATIERPALPSGRPALPTRGRRR